MPHRVRREKVLNTVDSIIKEDICRKILDVRNDAAHASTTGARRELSRKEIDAAVEHLRTVLFLFGNVAFAVAEKDEVGAIHAEEAASMLRHGPVNGAGSRVMPRPSGIFLPRQ